MFWFFKKREEDTGVSSRVKDLDKIMKSSFYNVKQDITELSGWVKEVHSNHKTHTSKLDEHDERLKKVEEKLSLLNQQLSNKEKYTAPQISDIKEELQTRYLNPKLTDTNAVFSSLTTTHKDLFMMIYQLQAQLGGNPVSFKSLASMAYAGKEYYKIRSTISQYLNFLHQLGLIDKKRYGKEAFISLTEIGMDVIKGKVKEEKKIRNKRPKGAG